MAVLVTEQLQTCVRTERERGKIGGSDGGI